MSGLSLDQQSDAVHCPAARPNTIAATDGDEEPPTVQRGMDIEVRVR